MIQRRIGITQTQRKILANARAGRALDYGRPSGRSTVGYWNCVTRSCQRQGWLDERTDLLTAKGRRVLDNEIDPKPEAPARIRVRGYQTAAMNHEVSL